jgi:hypothetical protein
MTDDTTHDNEWVTIDQAADLLGISSKKLLRKLQSKHNTLRLTRNASGLVVRADDVRGEVELQSSQPTSEKPKGAKTRPSEKLISFEGHGKTYHFR